MLGQRAQGTIPVQRVCKTLTCNNQLFSKRKNKSREKESGIWFVFHSLLNCALAAPSEPSLGGHEAHVLFRARRSGADPHCCCEVCMATECNPAGSESLPDVNREARSCVVATTFHD